MPTYQYRCTECGRDLEVVQKFTDPSLTECPTCSGPLRKVFNAVGVVFKGSGFYRTDSRAGAGGSDGGGDKGEDKGGDSADKPGKTDKAGEAKPSETKPSEAKPAAESKPKANSGTNGASSTTTKAAVN